MNGPVYVPFMCLANASVIGFCLSQRFVGRMTLRVEPIEGELCETHNLSTIGGSLSDRVVATLNVGGFVFACFLLHKRDPDGSHGRSLSFGKVV